MHRWLYRTCITALIALPVACPFQKLLAQSEQKQEDARKICDEQQALLLIHQQVESIKSLEPTPAGIAVLIRAGDLLWPRQEEAGRTVFAKAYELAEKYFQEKGDAIRHEGRLVVSTPDQRFSVMQAIARHDSVWAKRLAEGVAEETRRQAEKARLEAQNSAAQNSRNEDSSKMAEKTLNLAASLLATDEKSALALASNQMAYASGHAALNFLFQLVESNPTAADQLCAQAVKSYSSASLEGLFYVAAYIFLIESNIGPSGITSMRSVPQRLSPNSALQQLFLTTLFRRAEQSLRFQSDPAAGIQQRMHFPEAAEIYLALEKLEPHIAKYQPGFSERAAAMKSTLGTALSSDVRQQADATLRQRNEDQSGNRFEQMLDKAERESRPELRDQYFAFAAMAASNNESADRVLDIVKKVADEKLRAQVLSYIYFKLTQEAIAKGDFDEARRLAENVEQLDHRAYLSYEIAAQSLKKLEDKVRAREVLDHVVSAASKAPNTNEKARTLLGIAHLYAGFDSIRAFEVMAEAVKTINYIENPDFSHSTITQRIEGTYFSGYRSHSVTGFSLETSFRQLAPLDFDGALLIAQGLENRPMRATAIMALATSCLENAEKSLKETPEQKQKKHDKPQKQPAKKKAA
jgi:hypothetical protein